MKHTGTRKIGFVIDRLDSLKPAKDSSIAMIDAAARKGWEIHAMLQQDLYIESEAGQLMPRARSQVIEPVAGNGSWYSVVSEGTVDLGALDAILMRKDPPFDMEYINTTYILDLAIQAGSVVANHPAALRDSNEKMFITQFPQCCTPMCISRNQHREAAAPSLL